MLAKLACARFGQAAHIGLRAELQAARRTRLDARRFEPLSNAVRAQRALVDLLRRAVELWNIERTPGHAVLAADAGSDVDVFADLFRTLDTGAGNGARMAGNRLDLECARRHDYAFSIFTRNPLNSGVYALGSIAVGDRRFAEVRSVRPASSAIPR